MAYVLEGRSLSPISDLISEADFPLADYLPIDQVSSVFSGLYYTEADIALDGENVVVSAQLAFENSIEFCPAGCDSFSLVLASAGTRWSTLRATIVVGPDLALRLDDVTLGLRFSEKVLKDVGGGPAEISIGGDLSITPEGLSLENVTGASLAPAYLAGTEIIVEADDVRPVFGGAEAPPYLADQPDFEGVAIDLLRVKIPPEYLQLDGGSDVLAEMSHAAIGTSGFTGELSLASSDLNNPVSGSFLGFPFRFRSFALELVENALVEAALAVDLRIEELEDNSQEKWVGLDVTFGGDGADRFSAALSAVQPSEAGADAGNLATFEFLGAAKIGVQGLRLAEVGDVWSLYFTGNIELLIAGAEEWPRLEFDEFGIDSNGQLLLPEGGGIVFASPLVANWHFVSLTIPKFRFGRPDGEPDKFQIALSAEVNIIDGLPAGVSVDGLTITWEPGHSPDVTLAGIGVSFGVPGSFAAEVELAYVEENNVVTFKGRGMLALYSLDMKIEVGIVVGQNNQDPQDPFTFLYLFADAKLLPTGIPIGSTGLSVYGFQGLVAYNMELDVDLGHPVDERYYQLFIRAPAIGITHPDKWRMSRGDNALGAGIILGTADKGFVFNVKGLVAVAFPDLTLLLQSKASFLKRKPDMSTQSEGTLETLLVYAAADRALTFDIIARWGMSDLFQVSGSARAFFSFSDSSAWYLEIGQNIDGKRFRAQVLRWGGKWLFSAGFWFRLDSEKLVTGVLAELELRASAGGFFVEVVGRARAEMLLFWERPQWEGSLELSGRIAAGYRGLSVGISLGGSAAVRVPDPFELRLHVEACFKALFWKICLGHTFKWDDDDAPTLESPLRSWAATPRHWTPILLVAPNPADGENDPASLETGRQVLVQGGQITNVPPHSVISLNFAKPMTDETGRFNDVALLDNGGFITIGKGSGYNAQYRLDEVKLIRDPDGIAEDLPIWGTWDQYTLEQNTTLCLMSSERFGHDGSLSEAFPEDIEIDYCGEPQDTFRCVPFAGIEPGYGTFEDGSRYVWMEYNTDSKFRRSGPCIVLDVEDSIRVFPPEGTKEISVKTARHPLAASEEANGEIEIVRDFVVSVNSDGYAVISGSQLKQECLFEFCYLLGHSPRDPAKKKRHGKIVSEDEYWTVDAKRKLLMPNSEYELRVTQTPRLRRGTGTASAPLGSATTTARFTTSGPPKEPGALNAYVAGAYPADGQRPVYLGYDLVVRFKKDYVPFLYTLVGEQLVIRLVDAGGKVVTDDEGNPVLVPASRLGRIERRVTEKEWELLLTQDGNENCVLDAQLKVGEPSQTVLGIAAPANLRANSQYVAELVAADNSGTSPALFQWTFTTSRFETFAAMISEADRTLARARVVSAPPSASDAFDLIVRNLGASSVGFVDHFTATPYLSFDRARCLAILLEAPEPFESSLRLSVSVDGAAAVLVANLDETRVVVLPPSNGSWTAGNHLVELKWERKPNDLDEDTRAVTDNAGVTSTAAEIVTFDLDCGGF